MKKNSLSQLNCGPTGDCRKMGLTKTAFSEDTCLASDHASCQGSHRCYDQYFSNLKRVTNSSMPNLRMKKNSLSQLNSGPNGDCRKMGLAKLPLVRTHFLLLTTYLVEALTGAAINIFSIRKVLWTVRCKISA